jgi:hypothetical protein
VRGHQLRHGVWAACSGSSEPRCVVRVHPSRSKGRVHRRLALEGVGIGVLTHGVI